MFTPVPPYPIPWDWYIYLHEWLTFVVNLGVKIYIYIYVCIPVPWILWVLDEGENCQKNLQIIWWCFLFRHLDPKSVKSQSRYSNVPHKMEGLFLHLGWNHHSHPFIFRRKAPFNSIPSKGLSWTNLGHFIINHKSLTWIFLPFWGPDSLQKTTIFRAWPPKTGGPERSFWKKKLPHSTNSTRFQKHEKSPCNVDTSPLHHAKTWALASSFRRVAPSFRRRGNPWDLDLQVLK